MEFYAAYSNLGIVKIEKYCCDCKNIYYPRSKLMCIAIVSIYSLHFRNNKQRTHGIISLLGLLQSINMTTCGLYMYMMYSHIVFHSFPHCVVLVFSSFISVTNHAFWFVTVFNYQYASTTQPLVCGTSCITYGIFCGVL